MTATLRSRRPTRRAGSRRARYPRLAWFVRVARHGGWSPVLSRFSAGLT